MFIATNTGAQISPKIWANLKTLRLMPKQRKIIMTKHYCKLSVESESDFKLIRLYLTRTTQIKALPSKYETEALFNNFVKAKLFLAHHEYSFNENDNSLSFEFINQIPAESLSLIATRIKSEIICSLKYSSNDQPYEFRIRNNEKIINNPLISTEINPTHPGVKKAITGNKSSSKYKPLVLSDQELLSSPLMIKALEFDNETTSPERKSINSKKDTPFLVDLFLNVLLAFILLCPIATMVGLINTSIEIRNTTDLINSIIIDAPSTIFTLIPLSLILGMIFCVNDIIDKTVKPISQHIFSSKNQKQRDFDIFSRNINELRDIVVENNIGGLKSSLPLVSSWSDFFMDDPVYNKNIKYRLFYLIDNYAMDSFLEISNAQNPELMDELLKPFMISILRDVKNKYDKHILFEKQYNLKKEQELKEKIKQDIEIFENNKQNY